MEVVKRSGKAEPVNFDKITARIQKLCYGLDPEKVQATRVAQKVCAGVYPNVTTVELDDLAAQTAAYMSTDFPDYSLLAARIAVSNLHKMTIAVPLDHVHEWLLRDRLRRAAAAR